MIILGFGLWAICGLLLGMIVNNANGSKKLQKGGAKCILVFLYGPVIWYLFAVDNEDI